MLRKVEMRIYKMKEIRRLQAGKHGCKQCMFKKKSLQKLCNVMKEEMRSAH